MVITDLNDIAQIVVEKARHDKFILANDIQEELISAGVDAERWPEILEIAKEKLLLRKDRYYFQSPLLARARHDRDRKRAISRAIAKLIRGYKSSDVEVERRAHRRVSFFQNVRIISPDGQAQGMISQDISLTGIRFIGNKDLRGQRIRIEIPSLEAHSERWAFTVQVIWSAQLAEGMIENGGLFLDVETIEALLAAE